MKKILIISYFYYPCNLPASHRVHSFINYLHQFNFYPILITRNWQEESRNFDKKNKINSVEHQVYNGYEVYTLPHVKSLREKFVWEKLPGFFIKFQSKVFTFLELLLQNFFSSIIPFNNLYKFSLKYLKENNDISGVLISANPYILFKFGYLLNKKTGISWIADYRDDWTTNNLVKKNSILLKLLGIIETKMEKKWLLSSKCFISVSQVYVERIKQLINKEGHLVYNGYFISESCERLSNKEKNSYTICYVGTLYDNQPVEIFINAVKELIDENHKITVKFLGAAYDLKQKNRLQKAIGAYTNNFVVSDRVEHQKVLDEIHDSDLLLMLAYGELKGIPSAKLFDYLGSKKKIMLFPTDNDIIEEILIESNLGIIVNTVDEIKFKLINEINCRSNCDFVPNHDYISFFSRQEQVQQLSKILNNYFN